MGNQNIIEKLINILSVAAPIIISAIAIFSKDNGD
jgi:hypothetical protein